MVSIFYIKMGVVYMLAFENLYYIGSTIQKLNERLSIHKCDYKKWLNKTTKKYCYAYDIIKNDNYEVIIIEEVKNETKEECREREQNWIDFYGKKNLINKYNANGYDKDKHKNYNKEYLKEYRKINKEKTKQYNKDYYKQNK